MDKIVKFYDTNALLELKEDILKDDFYISTTTLFELEHIKTSRNKDELIKYNARKVIHILDDNPDKYNIVVYDKNIKELFVDGYGLIESPDICICACAKTVSDVVFVTNDLCCKMIAKNVFD